MPCIDQAVKYVFMTLFLLKINVWCSCHKKNCNPLLPPAVIFVCVHTIDIPTVAKTPWNKLQKSNICAWCMHVFNLKMHLWMSWGRNSLQNKKNAEEAVASSFEGVWQEATISRRKGNRKADISDRSNWFLSLFFLGNS